MIQIGPRHRSAAEFQLDDRHVIAAVLAAVGIAAEADAELLGRLRAHEGGVVPGQLRDRFGQFLKPTVVGEAAVVDRRVRLEDDFQLLGRGGGVSPLFVRR